MENTNKILSGLTRYAESYIIVFELYISPLDVFGNLSPFLLGNVLLLLLHPFKSYMPNKCTEFGECKLRRKIGKPWRKKKRAWGSSWIWLLDYRVIIWLMTISCHSWGGIITMESLWLYKKKSQSYPNTLLVQRPGMWLFLPFTNTTHLCPAPGKMIFWISTVQKEATVCDRQNKQTKKTARPGVE